MTRALLLLCSLALPAALSGCVACAPLPGPCARYEGVRATAPLAGDWDAARFEDRMEQLHDDVRPTGNGMFVRGEGFHAYVLVEPGWATGSGNGTGWSGHLAVSLESPDGKRFTTPEAAGERARDEWPEVRHHYDALVADLATLGLDVTSEPVVGCLCGEEWGDAEG